MAGRNLRSRVQMSDPGAGPSTARDNPGTSVAGPSTAITVPVTDGMEEHLTCSICCEVIHDCVGLQPCMHCFCGGCYTQWMRKSNDCPQCRGKVERVGPNHMVSNLIEAYLSSNPGKQRPAEDIKELDAVNKFKDIVSVGVSAICRKPDRPTGSDSDTEDDSYIDSGSPHDSESEYDDDGRNYSNDDRSTREGFSSPPKRQRRADGQNEDANMGGVCRQCPERNSPMRRRGSTHSSRSTGEPIPYVCTATVKHVRCSCCYEYMPDRMFDRLRNIFVPPQKCELCFNSHQYFCHVYFGRCNNFEQCHGCLAPLKNAYFSDSHLTKLISGNEFESSILLNHLASKNQIWPTVFRTCLTKLDAGEYRIQAGEFLPPGRSILVTSSTLICAHCARQCSSQLAYQYRREIDPNDLPAEVTDREDCYWGRKCRTQIKLHHAKNFNHICDQTRNQ